VKFFDRQRFDESGCIAVQLQKLLLLLLSLTFVTSLFQLPDSLVSLSIEYAFVCFGFAASFKKNSILLFVFVVAKFIYLLILLVASLAALGLITFQTTARNIKFHYVISDRSQVYIAGEIGSVVGTLFATVIFFTYVLLVMWSLVLALKLRKLCIIQQQLFEMEFVRQSRTGKKK